jgi:energy-coupling factor transport system permease protein
MMKMDARIKLLIALSLSAASFATYNLILLAALAGLGALLAILAGIPPRELLLRLRIMLAMIFSLFAIQTVSLWLSGSHFGSSCGLFAGVSLAGALSLRLLAVVFSGAFLSSSHIREYIISFGKMHFPGELSFMVMVTIRFVPLLREEAIHVKNAMVSRGRNFAALSLRGRLNAYSEFSSALVYLTILRAKDLAAACESRCIFKGKR